MKKDKVNKGILLDVGGKIDLEFIPFIEKMANVKITIKSFNELEDGKE